MIDYAKLIQPRFDDAREKLIRDTVTEATNTAIKTVKDRMLLLEMQTREQGGCVPVSVCVCLRSKVNVFLSQSVCVSVNGWAWLPEVGNVSLFILENCTFSLPVSGWRNEKTLAQNPESCFL